jgi:hypothetical protein
MIATQRAEDVRYLVPIRRIYTLYRSQTGALRYLGHAGTAMLENQPISNKLPDWNFMLNRNSNGQISLLVKFQHSSKSIQEKITIWNSLQHHPLSFTALNPLSIEDS